ncbi:right-handed parallel beta-helix repeat-containing protein, partial [bacterium]|nr:right-handed parallel beta-helix repeat-containing protein [bacterium]
HPLTAGTWEVVDVCLPTECPGVELSGTIEKEPGCGPWQGVVVRLMTCEGVEIDADVTDSQGHYDLDFEPGRHMVALDPCNGSILYYFAVDDGICIDFTCGQWTGNACLPDCMVRLSGVISMQPDCDPWPGVTVEVTDCEGSPITSDVTDTQGVYEVVFEPGPREVCMTPCQGGPTHCFTLGDDETCIEFTPGHWIGDACLPPCPGDTVLVCPNGTGDYLTISEAVAAAENGDVIELCDATFTGEDNRDIDFLGKAITVRSQSGDPTACIIDCVREPPAIVTTHGFVFHSGETGESIVEGVTIMNAQAVMSQSYPPPPLRGGAAIRCTNGSSPTIRNCIITNCISTASAGGISCEGSSPTIENCTFADNSASYGGAILCYSGSVSDITGCTFYDNEASRRGGGIYCYGASPTIAGCTLSDNAGGNAGGVVACDGGSSVTVENTIVAFSTESPGVSCETGGSASLECCDVYGNSGGDWVGCIASQYGAEGNISQDPLFCRGENPDAPYTLHSDSPCAPDHNPTCGLIGANAVGCAASGKDGSEPGDLELAHLRPNTPNPFNPETRITYTVPGDWSECPVLLSVYDATGRLIRTLVSARQSAGTYDVTWDGRDADGRMVASGVYFYRLDLDGDSETKRMILLK